VFGLLLVAASATLAQSGGGYDLHWSTPTAGGNAMAGASGYALTGTIARTDANAHGPMTSAGGYALSGGFWSGTHENDSIFHGGFEAAP